jgi:hypothetical protein
VFDQGGDQEGEEGMKPIKVIFVIAEKKIFLEEMGKEATERMQDLLTAHIERLNNMYKMYRARKMLKKSLKRRKQ